MKLFLLKRSAWDYNEHDEALIRAETEQAARDQAEQWLNAPDGAWHREDTTCEEVLIAGDIGIVIGSYRAG